MITVGDMMTGGGTKIFNYKSAIFCLITAVYSAKAGQNYTRGSHKTGGMLNISNALLDHHITPEIIMIKEVNLNRCN